MVKTLLSLFVLLSFSAEAQFLGFGGDSKANLKSRVPELLEKLKGLEMKTDPHYEESFNQGVKGIETAIEEEKLYCSGEAVDSEGKVLAPEKKQLCMRDLKKQYLKSNEEIFELKKKYLELIHTRQMDRLDEAQAKLKSNIEKNF